MFEHLDKGVLTPIKRQMRVEGDAHLMFVELQIGHDFPPDFIAFMISDQAVYPYRNSFPIPPKDGDGIRHFIDWEKMEIEYAVVNEAMREYFNIENPPSLLPLADTRGGNYVCLCVDEGRADYGAIYYWDHEGSIVRLANSFPEFLATVDYKPYEDELPNGLDKPKP